jgi:hypothetical protein
MVLENLEKNYFVNKQQHAFLKKIVATFSTTKKFLMEETVLLAICSSLLSGHLVNLNQQCNNSILILRLEGHLLKTTLSRKINTLIQN